MSTRLISVPIDDNEEEILRAVGLDKLFDVT
jgi:hypothetical protein